MRLLLIALILLLTMVGFAAAWDARPPDGATTVQPIELPPEPRAEKPAPAQPPASRPARPRATPAPRPARPAPAPPAGARRSGRR
jgi:hypothetical protein